MSYGGTGTVISGIGQSDVGRRLGRSGLSLTVDAALDALADSGLRPRRHRRVVDVAGRVGTRAGLHRSGRVGRQRRAGT